MKTQIKCQIINETPTRAMNKNEFTKQIYHPEEAEMRYI